VSTDYYFPEGEDIRAWIDWNADNVFDATEEIAFTNMLGMDASGTNTFSFTVPLAQTLGNYRLRVRMVYNIGQTTIDPCTLEDYGETEDYMVSVVAPPACLPPTALTASNITATSADLGWTSTASQWQIEYGTQGFTLGTGTNQITSNNPQNITITPNGSYSFYARAICGPGDTSTWAGPFLFSNSYCTYTTGTATYWMESFVTSNFVTNISNTNTGAGTTSVGYSDFTTQIAEGYPTQVVNFSIDASNNSTSYGAAIFVDWNNDYQFTLAERVYVTGSYIVPTITGSFTIPLSASLGTHRMRVILDYLNSAPSNPCSGSSAEAEDYTLNVVAMPNCLPPTSISGTSLPDTMKLTWNWVESNPFYPIQSFNIQYGMTGFGLYSSNSTIVPANGTDFNDTVADAALIGSGVYQVYVQAICQTGDTSAFAGPFTIVMPRTNDIVCQQEALQFDTTYTFNNVGATVESGESAIAPPATGAQTNDGWATSTLSGTLWYTFVAPASGSIRINATNSLQGYNGKAAVYEATNCSTFATFTMISANDNDLVGSNAAPNFTACGLTPGNTYYIMFDRVSGAGNFSLHLSEISLDAGTTNTAVTNVCSGTVLDLNTTITTSDTTGIWMSPIPSVNASINGSMLNTGGLAYQSFNIEYRVTDGCAYDSIVSVVKIFAPSNAGQDGTITACKNEPINLYSGLTGNVDFGGQWYDPSNAAVASSVTTSNFPGQYNFHYITSNGVCPADTALLVITVQATCNWLSLEEAALEDAVIYPNPSTGIININAPVNGMTLVVSDINGRVVETIAGNLPAGTSTINLKDVERGTYFFTLNNGGASKVFRIVMQ
jgi:hypothetical protein